MSLRDNDPDLGQIDLPLPYRFGGPPKKTDPGVVLTVQVERVAADLAVPGAQLRLVVPGCEFVAVGLAPAGLRSIASLLLAAARLLERAEKAE